MDAGVGGAGGGADVEGGVQARQRAVHWDGKETLSALQLQGTAILGEAEARRRTDRGSRGLLARGVQPPASEGQRRGQARGGGVGAAHPEAAHAALALQRGGHDVPADQEEDEHAVLAGIEPLVLVSGVDEDAISAPSRPTTSAGKQRAATIQKTMPRAEVSTVDAIRLYALRMSGSERCRRARAR